MFDLWKIGIRVSVLDYATIGLRGISRSFIQAQGSAAAFEKRLKSIKGQLKAGGLMVGAGMAIAAAFKPAVDKAIELEQAINRLKALNLGVPATSALMKQAQAISQNVKGTSYTDAIRLATETQSITGNVAHTQDILPMLAKIRFGVETYMASHGKGEGQGAVAEQQFRDIIKVMELRGLMRNFNAQQAQAMGDLFVKNFIASGGQVKPSDYLAMLKTGGVAGKLVSPDFMFALGHMMQESGGNRTGTALMSMYQNLIAGRTTQQVAEQLNQYGLLKPGSVHYGKTGHITKIAPESLVESQLLQSNPLDYMNQVLLPKLAAKGIDITNKDKVIPALNTLLSNRTASNFFSQLYLDRGVIANYMGQAKNAYGVEQLVKQGNKSTMGNLEDLQAKYTSLMAQLGMTVLPMLNRALELIIPKLQAFTNFAMRHPRIFQLLTDGLLGLAGTLVLFGSLNIIAGGMRLVGLSFTVLRVVPFLSIASGIGAFTKALLMSQIMGPSGLVTAARNFGMMVTAIGVLSQAAAVFAAAYVGWKVGQAASGALDRAAATETGGQEQTFGSYLYDRYHPFNPATGKREWSPWKGMWATDKDIMASNAAEAAALRTSPMPHTNMAEPARMPPTGAPRKSDTQPIKLVANLHLDGRQVAQSVTDYQVRGGTAAQTGMSQFDSSMFPTAAGVNGAY